MEDVTECRADDGEVEQIRTAYERGGWAVEVEREHAAVWRNHTADLAQGTLQIRDVPQPVTDCYNRERRIGKRQRQYVAGNKVESGFSRSTALRQLQHAVRDIETNGLLHLRSRGEDDVARPARKIEDAIGRFQARELNQPPLPVSILAVRKKSGDEI